MSAYVERMNALMSSIIRSTFQMRESICRIEALMREIEEELDSLVDRSYSIFLSCSKYILGFILSSYILQSTAMEQHVFSISHAI